MHRGRSRGRVHPEREKSAGLEDLDIKMNGREEASPKMTTESLKSAASFQKRMEGGVVYRSPSVSSGQV